MLQISNRDQWERKRQQSIQWPEFGRFRQDDKFEIYTLEGTMTADIGDWIIKGVDGEFYPCKPHIFEQTYEIAE